MNNNDKTKALDLAITQIKKQFGQGAIMKMGEGTELNVSAIPIGVMSLDML